MQQGNGYFENLLIDEPATAIAGEAYMNELERKSAFYYDLIAPYTVEVYEWKTSVNSGFSVIVWDSDKLILSDCSETAEIDNWYYNQCINREDKIMLPPCGGPFEMIDE